MIRLGLNIFGKNNVGNVVSFSVCPIKRHNGVICPVIDDVNLDRLAKVILSNFSPEESFPFIMNICHFFLTQGKYHSVEETTEECKQEKTNRYKGSCLADSSPSFQVLASSVVTECNWCISPGSLLRGYMYAQQHSSPSSCGFIDCVSFPRFGGSGGLLGAANLALAVALVFTSCS